MALPIWARGSWDRLSLFLSRAVGPLQPQLLEPFPRWCFQRLVQSATFPPGVGLEPRGAGGLGFLACFVPEPCFLKSPGK